MGIGSRVHLSRTIAYERETGWDPSPNRRDKDDQRYFEVYNPELYPNRDERPVRILRKPYHLFIKEWVDGNGETQKSVAYHIDDLAAKFFEPNLVENNTVRENQAYNTPGWSWRTLNHSLPTMQSLEYVPWRLDRHPLDTDTRRYEMLRQFTMIDVYPDLLDIPKTWKYISTPDTGPIVNSFTTTSKVRNRITVDVNVGSNIKLCLSIPILGF